MVKTEKAGIPDIAELTDLRLSYLNEDFGMLTPEDMKMIRQRLPEYFRRHLNNDLFCYVIREQEEIVSCAFLLVTEKPMSPSFMNGKTGTVLNVCTKPDFRHRGFAKEIMRALLADADEMELSVIELKATEAGERLYREAGFEDDSSHYRHMHRRNRNTE